RHPQRLGLDVPEGELDARDGLVGDPAQVLPRAAEQVPVQALHRARVLAHQQWREIAHAAGDAVGAAVVAALPPADEGAIGLDADEGPGSPAAVAMQRFHTRDLHRASWSEIMGRPSYPKAATAERAGAILPP